MTIDKFTDCYYSFSNGVFIIGNACIEHTVHIEDGILFAGYLLNKDTGYRWQNPALRTALFNLPVPPADAQPRISSRITDNDGLSESFLSVELQLNAAVRLRYAVAPETPFISAQLFVASCNESATPESIHFDASKPEHAGKRMPHHDAVYSLPLNERHLHAEAIRLHDITDTHDHLVKKHAEALYNREQSFAGNMFVLNNYVRNEALMLVKEGPTAEASLHRKGDEFRVASNRSVELVGSGIDVHESGDAAFPAYGISFGTGNAATIKREYKKMYGKMFRDPANRSLYVMSNTWGDGNSDQAVCEEFMMKEIDAAKEIGADVVQIDDGWEKGITMNSRRKKGGVWEGYYADDPDFWQVNKERFPNGLGKLVAHAKANGLGIGLWFSPDSSHDFANWEKDAETILQLYRSHGIRYFKLDGIKIRNKRCELNLKTMLERVTRESGGVITFNMDVTAEVRFGYLYEKQYGTLFVENRYTNHASYYPHRTLKNLWLLAEVVPARRLQFEVLNHRRNPQKYGDDPLAPANYSIDYLFASVMVSNPLLWMEMQHLSPEDRRKLAEIVCVFRKEREHLRNAEVLPVGKLPDGTAFTGFQVIVDATNGYLILFREYTGDSNYRFTLHDLAGKNLEIEILASNLAASNFAVGDKVDSEGRLDVELRQPRSYVFLKYRVSASSSIV
jgi:alpha-galactosidase